MPILLNCPLITFHKVPLSLTNIEHLINSIKVFISSIIVLSLLKNLAETIFSSKNKNLV